MATSLKSLTSLSANPRKIARLLQAKAPEGHFLAYINEEEAALLKARGGSGKPHADTGVPSFEDEEAGFETFTAPTETTPTDTSFDSAVTPVFVPEAPTPAAPAAGSTTAAALFGPSGYGEGMGATPEQAYSLPAREAYDQAAAMRSVTGEPTTPAAPEKGMSKELMARLGIAGLQGVLGAQAAKKAAATGQAGAQEMKTLAAPYQQQGQQLQAAASRGELTPQAQQSLQAAQAQAAQAIEKRGGVGVAQATQQIESLRQQLLQSQYDYGLKLSGIGDQIALGAIKTGMQADQYANQLTSSFFNNIARTVYGTPGG